MHLRPVASVRVCVVTHSAQAHLALVQTLLDLDASVELAELFVVRLVQADREFYLLCFYLLNSEHIRVTQSSSYSFKLSKNFLFHFSVAIARAMAVRSTFSKSNTGVLAVQTKLRFTKTSSVSSSLVSLRLSLKQI